VPGLPRLYLITDRRLVPDGDLAAALAAPITAGVRLVQLREKDLSARDLLSLARAVKARTDAAGASLLINDRADVAVAVGATGVHLTSADPPIAEVRAWLGPTALIGVSTHTPEEAAAAGTQGASFVTFGPVYDTPSKRGMGAPVGTQALAEAGAHGIAVIRAVLAEPNPGAAAGRLLGTLGRWREGGRSL